MSREEKQMAQLEESFIDFAREYPQSALSLITGIFVGLVEYNIEVNGGDPNMEIFIDGCENRNITLSAIKAGITENANERITD